MEGFFEVIHRLHRDKEASMDALVSGTIELTVDEWQFYVSMVDESYLGNAPTANGLVRSVGGAAMVKTGIYSGEVAVKYEAYDADPGPVSTDDTSQWTEIAEVPLEVTRDDVRVMSPYTCGDWRQGKNLAVSGPGLYQLRVCACGRDSDRDAVGLRSRNERYLVQLWPTTAATTRLVAAADSVGAGSRSGHQPSDEIPGLGWRISSVPERVLPTDVSPF